MLGSSEHLRPPLQGSGSRRLFSTPSPASPPPSRATRTDATARDHNRAEWSWSSILMSNITFGSWPNTAVNHVDIESALTAIAIRVPCGDPLPPVSANASNSSIAIWAPTRWRRPSSPRQASRAASGLSPRSNGSTTPGRPLWRTRSWRRVRTRTSPRRSSRRTARSDRWHLMTCPCAGQTAKPKRRTGVADHAPLTEGWVISRTATSTCSATRPCGTRTRVIGGCATSGWWLVAQRHRHNRSGPPSPLVSEHATNTAPGPAAPL
jgi:hypothetical protein